MKKLFLIITLSLFSFPIFSQNPIIIRSILARQQENWNNGDINAFMEDYWHSDSLMFIGKNGVIYGWKATKERYLKTYPDKATMGKLSFEIIKTDFLSKKTVWVLGKWNLIREEKGNVGGYFTLILKFIEGKWQIISDHTS